MNSCKITLTNIIFCLW